MAKPLTRLLLRSPLHRLVSGRNVLLTVDGYSRVVRYVEQDGRIVVVGGDDEQWWRPLAAEQPALIEVVLRGRRHHAEASLAEGEELDAAMISYLHAHPRDWRHLGVDPRGSADDVATAARSVAVILLAVDPH